MDFAHLQACNRNGKFCLGPSLFVSAALILSISASASCRFADIDKSGDEDVQVIDAVGFWCFEAFGSRFSLEGLSFDNTFSRARALGVAANLTGFSCWVLYLCAGCIPFPPIIFLITGLGLLLACGLEGSKLTLLDSTFFCQRFGRSCSMDTGAVLAICACVLYFVAALMTLAHYKERIDAKKNEDQSGNNNQNMEVP